MQLGLLTGYTHQAEQLGYYRQAVAAAERVHGPTSLAMIDPSVNLGFILKDNKAFAEATPHFERAVEIGSKSADSGVRVRAASHFNYLVNVLSDAGKKQQALDVARRAAHFAVATLGPQHEDTGSAWTTAGLLELEAANFAAAREDFEKSLAIWEALKIPAYIRGAKEKIAKVDQQMQQGAPAPQANQDPKAAFIAWSETFPMGRYKLRRFQTDERGAPTAPPTQDTHVCIKTPGDILGVMASGLGANQIEAEARAKGGSTCEVATQLDQMQLTHQVICSEPNKTAAKPKAKAAKAANTPQPNMLSSTLLIAPAQEMQVRMREYVLDGEKRTLSKATMKQLVTVGGPCAATDEPAYVAVR
jgi:tetratricopeptide (TPR) repeat protein